MIFKYEKALRETQTLRVGCSKPPCGFWEEVIKNRPTLLSWPDFVNGD